MVVDDVEDYTETERVRAVDERAQIIRRAVKPRRRKKIYTVITPAEATGKVGDRHHLKQGYAALFQHRQLLHRRSPRSFRRERADMKLVYDLTGYFTPGQSPTFQSKENGLTTPE